MRQTLIRDGRCDRENAAFDRVPTPPLVAVPCAGCRSTAQEIGSERVDGGVAPRAPHLYSSLRSFVLGAFAYLLRELDEGAELPVAFVEHEHAGGPALYEYRPLVRAFVEERASRLRGRDDALIALEELQREPAAAIFARAHAGPRPSEDEALFRTVLLGLLVSTAEACGGFDWDDESFDRAYAELERSLYRRAANLRSGGSARRHLGDDPARARAGLAGASGG